MSNVECRMSNVECRMSNVECRMSNVECRMSNVECRTSNVECRMSNVECRMSNVECRMSNVECRKKMPLVGAFFFALLFCSYPNLVHNGTKHFHQSRRDWNMTPSKVLITVRSTITSKNPSPSRRDEIWVEKK
jgi:hypothetical protein